MLQQIQNKHKDIYRQAEDVFRLRKLENWAEITSTAALIFFEEENDVYGKKKIIHIVCVTFFALLIPYRCLSNIPINNKKSSGKIDIVPEAKLMKSLQQTRRSFLSNTIWQTVGEKYKIDPYLLYSIAILESSKSNKVNFKEVHPWPYAIRVNKTGQSYYPATRDEAEAILLSILQQTDNIDIGLMQINYHWHKDKVRNPIDLLDPEINLEVAARIFSRAIKSCNDMILGIGRYHSWKFNKAYKYGNRVYLLYTLIKKYAKGVNNGQS